MTGKPDLSETEWPARLTAAIAGEVRRHRDVKGMSAQQLSDACAQLGLPIHRSVLANLENGRRSTLSVAELLVIASALDVAPVFLIAPAGHLLDVEILPGKVLDTLTAVAWLAGDVDRRWTEGIEEATSYQLAEKHQFYLDTVQRVVSEGLHLAERRDSLAGDIEVLMTEQSAVEVVIIGLRQEMGLATSPGAIDRRGRIPVLQEQIESLEQRKTWLTQERDRYDRQTRLLEEVDACGGLAFIVHVLGQVRAEMLKRGMDPPALPDALQPVLEQKGV